DGDDELAAMLAEDRGLQGATSRWVRHVPVIRHWLIPYATIVTVDGPPAGFRILPIPSTGDLAAVLGLGHTQLAWFADEKRLNASADDVKLSHYHHRWLAKRRGGWRLVEAPKRRLKEIQRWLLDHVLAPIPPSDVA